MRSGPSARTRWRTRRPKSAKTGVKSPVRGGSAWPDGHRRRLFLCQCSSLASQQQLVALFDRRRLGQVDGGPETWRGAHDERLAIPNQNALQLLRRVDAVELGLGSIRRLQQAILAICCHGLTPHFSATLKDRACLSAQAITSFDPASQAHRSVRKLDRGKARRIEIGECDSTQVLWSKFDALVLVARGIGDFADHVVQQPSLLRGDVAEAIVICPSLARAARDRDDEVPFSMRA